MSSRKPAAAAPKEAEPDVKLSKSQKKKQKRLEIEAIIDRKLDEIRARDVEKKDDVDDLFVVDTKGNLESRSSRKRRAKLEAAHSEPAPPVKKVKRPSATAAAAARTPSVSGRKKAKSSAKSHDIDVPKAPSLSVDGDLWAPVPEVKVIDPETNFEVTDVLVKQRKRRSPSESKKGMVTTPVEELPHAGQSYNPLPEAHQEAIMKAYEVESKRLKDQEELALKLRHKHPSQQPKLIEAPVESEENDESTAAVKKKPKALTKAERNRRKRLETQTKEREKEKQQKDLLKQIGQLPRLVKELKQDAAAQKSDEPVSQQKKHKLGKHEFEAAFPEVALSDELTGNLRAAPVRTTDVVMREQFKKMQAKGFIEPRVRVTKYHRAPKMAPKVISRSKYVDSVPL